MRKVVVDDATSSGSYMVRADDLQSQQTIFEKGNNRMDETVMSNGSHMVKVDDNSSQGTNFFAAGGANETHLFDDGESEVNSTFNRMTGNSDVDRYSGVN